MFYYVCCMSEVYFLVYLNFKLSLFCNNYTWQQVCYKVIYSWAENGKQTFSVWEINGISPMDEKKTILLMLVVGFELMTYQSLIGGFHT